LFEWVKKIFGSAKPPVPEEKRYFFLAQEDEETLGFLSDRYAEFFPKIEQSFTMLESPAGPGSSDLERILSASGRSANFAMALVQMYFLQQSLLSGVSRILKNKQEYMARENEFDLATNFKVPGVSGRCPRSISLLSNILSSLPSSPAIALPSEEMAPLWDNPVDVAIAALPSYVSFHALCSILLDVDDVPDAVVGSTPLLRRNALLEVRLNDAWAPVSDSREELRRRQRFFFRRILEARNSFLANDFPRFLLSLNYEPLLFSALDFFSIESALNDLRSFLNWYSGGSSALSADFRSELDSIQADAVDLYSVFNGLVSEFEAKMPLLASKERSDVFSFLAFLGSCAQAQARMVNGLVRIDARFSGLDSSLGALSKKVWRFDFRRIGRLFILQFVPYSSLLSAASGRTIHPSLRDSYLELNSLLGNNRSILVSSANSQALLGLYLDCNVSIASAEASEPSRLPIVSPDPLNAQLSRDFDSRLSALWDKFQ